tara:strand:- start:414 stop:677 length:264 start_codon:yes stop_codon:yes gene_type:complete
MITVFPTKTVKFLSRNHLLKDCFFCLKNHKYMKNIDLFSFRVKSSPLSNFAKLFAENKKTFVGTLRAYMLFPRALRKNCLSLAVKNS